MLTNTSALSTQPLTTRLSPHDLIANHRMIVGEESGVQQQIARAIQPDRGASRDHRGRAVGPFLFKQPGNRPDRAMHSPTKAQAGCVRERRARDLLSI
jgi:protein gp37